MNYLYHYTSLETLALILKNRTICFNNLLYVDDIEEAETEDMEKMGRLIYVSCWTKDSEESIPLWNLYTPNMHGVRIKMPEFPFEKYHYKKGQFFLTEDVDTYINIEKMFYEDKVSIVPTEPHLIEVQYTNEQNKLFPKIKTESTQDALKKFLEAKDLDELRGNEDLKINYSIKDLGRYKRENWRFQKEWRYIISTSPMGLQEMNPPSLKKQQEQLRKIENNELEPAYKQLFLKLDESVLKDIEIVFGPKMNDAEKIMAVSLIKMYCPEATYRDSTLRIKE